MKTLTTAKKSRKGKEWSGTKYYQERAYCVGLMKKKTYDKKIANCSQAESSKMTRNDAACQRALALGKSPASQRINKHV